MSSATVIDYGKFSSTYTPKPTEVLGNGFKSYLYKYVSPATQPIEVIIDFGAPVKVHTVHLTNTTDTFELKGLIGAHIRQGDDASEFNANN